MRCLKVTTILLGELQVILQGLGIAFIVCRQYLGGIDMNMQQGETDNISAITILAESKNSDRDAPLSVMQEFCYTDSSELAE